MTHDRTLAPSPFPGDDGSADPQIRAALGAAATQPPESYLNAVAALCTARLLVPIVATATQEAAVHAHGPVEHLLRVDKEADMAVVMLRAADGRTALLSFTGVDSLEKWNASARPVPVTLDRLCATAVQQSADAVIVDIEGPAPLVLEGEVVTQLAAGHRLVRMGDAFGWMSATA